MKEEVIKKEDISIMVSSLNDKLISAEMFRNYGINTAISERILDERGLKWLSEPLMGKKNSYLYLTLKALQKLCPEVNCKRIFYQGEILGIRENKDEIELFDPEMEQGDKKKNKLNI